MEIVAVDVSLLSARDLYHGNPFSEIKAYAVAWITIDSQSSYKIPSPLDTTNGTNPNWNYHVIFLVERTSLLRVNSVLEVGINNGENGLMPEEIGRVAIPLKDIWSPAYEDGLRTRSVEYVSYTILSRSGECKGILNLAVKIGGRTAYDAGAFPGQPTYHQSQYEGYTPVGHSPGPSCAPPGPLQGVPHYQSLHPLAYQAYPPQGQWGGPPSHGGLYALPPPQGVPNYGPPYPGYPPEGGTYSWAPYHGYHPQGNHTSQHNLVHSPVSFVSGVVTVLRALLMLDDLGNLTPEFINNGGFHS